jgi:hypothetical protein
VAERYVLYAIMGSNIACNIYVQCITHW